MKTEIKYDNKTIIFEAEECDAEHCLFNPHGFCLIPSFKNRPPYITDDGCKDYRKKEESHELLG